MVLCRIIGEVSPRKISFFIRYVGPFDHLELKIRRSAIVPPTPKLNPDSETHLYSTHTQSVY